MEAWAWEELAKQLELQVLEDGSHWEQSAMYHVEVLNACSRLALHVEHAREAGMQVPAEAEAALRHGGWLMEAIRKMTRHVLYSAAPDHCQPAQCDSDVTDIRDVMVRSAVILEGERSADFCPGMCRYVGGVRPDMDSAWQLGISGIRRYEALEPAAPERRSLNCEDSGNIFVRSGWGEDAHYTWMKSGALGSGHGHADLTHVSLYYRGQPFLSDSGRYTYREEDPLRVALKAPQAHNVCVIDGESGGVPDGSWTYRSFGESLKNYYREEKDIHYAEMAFHGTLEDGTPYLIIRKLLILDVGIWVSVYDVCCQGEHQAKEYFHLAAQAKAAGRDLLRSPGAGQASWLLQSGGERLVLYAGKHMELGWGTISARYNEKTEAPVLTGTVDFADRLTDASIFAPEDILVRPAEVFQTGSSQPASREVVTAWDFLVSERESFTVLIWNRETCQGGKMYTCHGVPVYGKTVVLHENDGAYRRIRLKN